VRRLEVSAPDGRKLETAVGGADRGPLVLLHHGTPGAGSRIWPPHAELARARGLRLATYSRPGFGDSERLPGRTVADSSADACTVADALDADVFYTAGSSGGGPCALACAALIPSRVLAAASVAGLAPRDAEGLHWFDGMAVENRDEFVAAADGEPQLELFIRRWIIRRWAAAKGPVDRSRFIEALGELASEPDTAVVTDEYADFATRIVRDSLRNGIWGWLDDDLSIVTHWGFDIPAVEAPVTIWHGRQDRFVPAHHGEWLATHVPRARARLLDGHGHLSLELSHFDAVLDDLVRAAPPVSIE
jgi:pimeloyl-ACP methyl ester carboxylesterase